MDTLPSKHNERGGTFLKRVCLLFRPEKELTSFQTSFLLALIGLLALAVRLLSLRLEPALSRDGCLYLELIQVWHDTGSLDGVLKHWPEFWIPPFPLYLMLLVMKCGFSAYLSGVGVNIFLGSLLPGIIYLIANEVCRSRRIALASALLIALNPPMIELAVEPLRDTVYLFFAGLVICLLIFCIRRQKWYLWGITGVFLGMAFLTRYETLEFFPLAGICWVIAICRKTMDWKKLLICCFSLSAAFVVTVCLLISAMGAEDHLYKSYGKYYLVKWKNIEKKFCKENILK